MGSTSREARTKQKERAEAALEARKVALEEAGVTGKAVGRDPLYRTAKAELRKATKRLQAIDTKDASVVAAAERKAKKAEELKSGKGKKKGDKKKDDKKKGGKKKDGKKKDDKKKDEKKAKAK